MAIENWKIGFKILITQFLTYIFVFGVTILIILSQMFTRTIGKVILIVWLLLSFPFGIWISGVIGKNLWKWK